MPDGVTFALRDLSRGLPGFAVKGIDLVQLEEVRERIAVGVCCIYYRKVKFLEHNFAPHPRR